MALVKVEYDETLGTNVKDGKLISKTVENGPHLDKGAEVGRFEFGSTIILLFEPGAVELFDEIQPNAAVRMGQAIGRMVRK